MLRIAPAAVYEAARRGELRHTRKGGYVRFKVSDILAWPRENPEAFARAQRRTQELDEQHLKRFPELREATLAYARERGIDLPAAD